MEKLSREEVGRRFDRLTSLEISWEQFQSLLSYGPSLSSSRKGNINFYFTIIALCHQNHYIYTNN